MDVYPFWWDWELEIGGHVRKRMVDRQFNEADLRQMVEDAFKLEPNHEEGRFVLHTRHEGNTWAVIVEPAELEELLVVITAYPET